MLLEEVKTLSLNKIDWSLCISILALIASVLTYILHDRRLKRQEHFINEHQIKKISEEQDENAKALIKANVVKHPKGKREIKIFNAGKAIANNIKVEILSELSGMHTDDLDELFPYEFLNPQEGTQFFIFLYEGPTKILKIKMSWDDSYRLGRNHEQILTL
ncbi:hypothetical protein [Pedobacter gandavensis]|uniref:hypothetical protein n=1 Tax=Pedobacter gandavensis TaxID=2679963 RepID=UPI0029311D58|nr:hypothetical protein [Pedobacter gandavensis]